MLDPNETNHSSSCQEGSDLELKKIQEKAQSVVSDLSELNEKRQEIVDRLVAAL